MDYEAKIAKIMERANHSGTPQNERDLCLIQAMELAAKWGIDIALIEQGKPSLINDKEFRFGPPRHKDKAYLFGILARGCNCEFILIKPKETLYHIFGYQSDIERADALYKILWPQVITQIAWVQAKPWENLTELRKDWFRGFAHSIRDRLAEANSKAEADSEPGTALVLVNRKAEVDRSVAKAYPTLRMIHRTYRQSDAYYAGREAGRNASMNLHREVE